MRTLVASVLVVTALGGGCGGKPAAEHDCATAVANVQRVLAAGAGSGSPGSASPPQPSGSGKNVVTEALLRMCQASEGGWSAETRQCASTARTTDAVIACNVLVTRPPP